METMESQTTPTSVNVISVIWIILGMLMIFSALVGLFSFTMMPQNISGSIDPTGGSSELPAGVNIMMLIFKNFHILSILMIIIGIVAILSGINLLKLRSWARTAIESLTWLGLAYIVAFGIFWIYIWMSMVGQVPQDQTSTDINTAKYFGLVMGIIVQLILGVPLVIMLVKLKKSVVKNIVR